VESPLEHRHPDLGVTSGDRMPLHSILTTILAEYPKAKIEPFCGNPLANFLRYQAADEVQNALGDLTVEGSAGAGNWAVAPWISVFDPAITIGFSELSRVSRQSDVYRSTNTSSGSRACGLKGGKSVAKS